MCGDVCRCGCFQRSLIDCSQMWLQADGAVFGGKQERSDGLRENFFFIPILHD